MLDRFLSHCYPQERQSHMTKHHFRFQGHQGRGTSGSPLSTLMCQKDRVSFPIQSSSSSQLVTPPVIYPVGTSGPTSGHPQISDPMPLIYNSMGNSIPPEDLDGQYQTIEPTSVTSVRSERSGQSFTSNHSTIGLNLNSEPEVSILSQPKVITPGYLETHRVSKSKGELEIKRSNFEMSSKCS